jgi:hypothetical protein
VVARSTLGFFSIAREAIVALGRHHPQPPPLKKRGLSWFGNRYFVLSLSFVRHFGSRCGLSCFVRWQCARLSVRIESFGEA